MRMVCGDAVKSRTHWPVHGFHVETEPLLYRVRLPPGAGLEAEALLFSLTKRQRKHHGTRVKHAESWTCRQQLQEKVTYTGIIQVMSHFSLCVSHHAIVLELEGLEDIQVFSAFTLSPATAATQTELTSARRYSERGWSDNRITWHFEDKMTLSHLLRMLLWK